MLNMAIVVVAYNRLNSLQRLIKSLEEVEYCGEEITLIISIDKSDDESVVNYSNKYKWKHGKKIVRTFPKNMGLKSHVLSCGEYLNEFDAIAVLEDDTFVSKNLYTYMKDTVTKYYNNDRIAGISLYQHLWQIDADRPFEPLSSKYDCYFLKYAQSWGQIWMKNQWFDFMQWYEQNKEFTSNSTIPKNISRWPESSWLKYHIKYCIEKDKYFVYPYTSLTTNFTEVGTHNSETSTKYQVPLSYEIRTNYVLPELTSDNSIKYDQFFELEEVFYTHNNENHRLTLDLFGTKTNFETRYLLSTQQLEYKIINSYGLELRPHEQNFFYDINGNQIFLYDIRQKENNKFSRTKLDIWEYDTKSKNLSMIVKYLLKKIKVKFRS